MITGNQSRDIYSKLTTEFLPESILIHVPDAQTLEQLSKYEYFQGKEFGEKPLAYVCRASTCLPPVDTVQQVLDLVK